MATDTSLRAFLEGVTPSGSMTAPAFAELERLRCENEHLQRALKSRATIDQAKGIVMAVERCTPDEAFEALVRMSQHSNVPLRDVAAALVCSASDRREMFRTQPRPPESGL